MGIVSFSDMDVNTRREIARNPQTSPRDLRQLIEDNDTVVRLFAAMNPNTPEELKEDSDLLSHVSSNGEIFAVWANDVSAYNFNSDEWQYHVGPCDPGDFDKHSVIYNQDGRDEYYGPDPDWWADTMAFIKPLDFESLGQEEFVSLQKDNQNAQDVFGLGGADWENALSRLYDAYFDNNGDTPQFWFDAVRALHPDTVFKEANVSSPWSQADWVTVFYDWDSMDEIDEHDLKIWYFWEISEARSKYLNVEDLRDTAYDEIVSGDLWDLFESHGEYTDDWCLIPDEELLEARRNGRELEFLADELGYDAEYCVLM